MYAELKGLVDISVRSDIDNLECGRGEMLDLVVVLAQLVFIADSSNLNFDVALSQAKKIAAKTK